MIDDPKQADDIVAGGRADMVAIARALLADPRWPWRAAAVLGHDIEVAPQYRRAAHLPKQWVEREGGASFEARSVRASG